MSSFVLFAVYCVTVSDCCLKPTVHECGRGEAVAGAETRSLTHRVVPPMVQAVSRLGVRTKVSPCGILGVSSGTGTGFSASPSVFTSQYRTIVYHQCYILGSVVESLQNGII